jgi:hypothetical protein
MSVRGSGLNHVIELDVLTIATGLLDPGSTSLHHVIITLPKRRTSTCGGAQTAAGAADR